MTTLSQCQLTNSWHDFAQQLVARPLIDNIDLTRQLLNINNLTMPVTLNLTGAPDVSWVASLRNSYGMYAREEIKLNHIRGWRSHFFSAASMFAERLLCAAKTAGGIYLNNWLVATNIYAPQFNLATILAACEQLTKYQQPIIIRSLTPHLHAALMQDLIQHDFLLIPTRQIWLVTDAAEQMLVDYRDNKKDVRWEQQQLKTSEWIPASEFSAQDYIKAAELYQQLYMQKYSRYNPKFSPAYLQAGVKSNWLCLTGLRYFNQPLCGVVGMIGRNNIFTAPILGYELNADRKLGLYRRLSLHILTKVMANGGILHQSGGAGDFKFNRGAQPHIEYAAIYLAHLPKMSKLPIQLLNWLTTQLVVPYMQQNKL